MRARSAPLSIDDAHGHSRPPPPVAKTNDLKANVRAVVTLRTTEEVPPLHSARP